MTRDNKEVDETKTQNVTKRSPFISMITDEKKGRVESEVIYDTDTQIKMTQNRIWKALKRRYQYRLKHRTRTEFPQKSCKFQNSTGHIIRRLGRIYESVNDDSGR